MSGEKSRDCGGLVLTLRRYDILANFALTLEWFVRAQAGTTGLSAAKIVSTSTATLTGTTITAEGCDVGIYVAPTTSSVIIKGVTVTGANDHGIFVQDASHITIETSKVEGNGLAPTPSINENKAIELVGTSNAMVVHDTVTGNVGGGVGGVTATA